MVKMHLELPTQKLLDLQTGDDVVLFLKACTASLSNPIEQQGTTTEVGVRFCQSLTTKYTSVAMDNVHWLFKTLALRDFIELNKGKGRRIARPLHLKRKFKMWRSQWVYPSIPNHQKQIC